jgi:hypothetical protein
VNQRLLHQMKVQKVILVVPKGAFLVLQRSRFHPGLLLRRMLYQHLHQLQLEGQGLSNLSFRILASLRLLQPRSLGHFLLELPMGGLLCRLKQGLLQGGVGA